MTEGRNLNARRREQTVPARGLRAGTQVSAGTAFTLTRWLDLSGRLQGGYAGQICSRAHSKLGMGGEESGESVER